MTRPRALTILAWGFVVFGAVAVWDTVEALLHNRAHFNFAMLMIPVGLGLLKGRESSLMWAKFWVGLMAVSLFAALILYPFLSDSYHVRFFGQELEGLTRHVVAVLIPSALLVLVLGLWRILVSPSVKVFVKGKGEASSVVAS